MKYLIPFLLLILIACQTVPQEKVSENFVPRKNYQARLEPADGVLHGAGQDFDSFIKYTEVLGKKHYPVIYMDYIGLIKEDDGVQKWGEKLKAELAQMPADVMPQIGLNLTAGNDDGSGQDSLVASGAYDPAINVFVEALQSLGRPAFVRIGYEFEGSWNGYTPSTYVAVFKRITDAMRAAKVNAATVWCAAGGSAGFIPLDSLAQYYPGDEYVDWWGIDVFSPEEITHPRLIEFLEWADEHQKPVMLGECTPRYVGVMDGKVSWDKWFGPFFNLIEQRPQIKAFCYINWDWVYWSDELGFQWHDWKDARIELDEYVSMAYQAEMKKPFYIHVP
ncbi:MAG: glycosyl hydrolase [Bacteroidota bacterium]